jgi:hypothetical protein
MIYNHNTEPENVPPIVIVRPPKNATGKLTIVGSVAVIATDVGISTPLPSEIAIVPAVADETIIPYITPSCPTLMVVVAVIGVALKIIGLLVFAMILRPVV